MASGMQSANIDHIPVIWFEPETRPPQRKLAIYLMGLSGKKEDTIPFLQDLAKAGFVAPSFDNWMHGERTSLTGVQVAELTFDNFRRHMWVNIGQSAMDSLRIIDWAIQVLNVDQEICMGGLSMGGDISVAVAGIDRRIRRVGAVIATPDWLRPGMVDLLSEEKRILPPGNPDSYSLLFYELFNPITHLEHYAHAPKIRFVCGEKDDQVPTEAAFRFKAALAELYPKAADQVSIDLVPGLGHIEMALSPDRWWPQLLAWMTQ
ncbi:MAG: prolyl oligopeptidase family serine peptidase [Thermodesulfobacteriota bacterium]